MKTKVDRACRPRARACFHRRVPVELERGDVSEIFSIFGMCRARPCGFFIRLPPPCPFATTTACSAGRGGTRPTRGGEAARHDRPARARPREGRFDSRTMSKLHENHVVPPDRLTGTNCIRNSGHNLDLLTAGRDVGRRKTGMYAPQNFPPKPSPLPNDLDFRERCVERPTARARARRATARRPARPLFSISTPGERSRKSRGDALTARSNAVADPRIAAPIPARSTGRSRRFPCPPPPPPGREMTPLPPCRTASSSRASAPRAR